MLIVVSEFGVLWELVKKRKEHFKERRSWARVTCSIVYNKCTQMVAIRRPFSIQSQPLKGLASSFVRPTGQAVTGPRELGSWSGLRGGGFLRPRRPCLLTTGLAGRLLEVQLIKTLCSEAPA